MMLNHHIPYIPMHKDVFQGDSSSQKLLSGNLFSLYCLYMLYSHSDSSRYISEKYGVSANYVIPANIVHFNVPFRNGVNSRKRAFDKTPVKMRKGSLEHHK
jgi:hypothetical protein